ncbi:DUSAM domain-containing protein [Corallococcus terminator]
MSEAIDWDPIRALAQRVVRNGEPLVLTADVRELLLRTAREVAISPGEAEQAIATTDGAMKLLTECSHRIHDGSWRVMRALNRMYKNKKAGDFDSARQEMRDVLAVEVVPYYRELAQEQLDDMADEP